MADYIARRIAEPIEIDGNIDKPVWRNATWSRRFVDMTSGAPGMFDTKTAIYGQIRISTSHFGRKSQWWKRALSSAIA